MVEKGIMKKVILLSLSIAAGLVGFLINSRFFYFSYMGLELSLPIGYIFPLFIALLGGGLLSLPAALISASFLFLNWDFFGWGTLYVYIAHVAWIPLMGWCRKKEKEQDRYPLLSYVVLLFYSLIHIALYHIIFNPLMSLNHTLGGWDSRMLLILSYRDNMTFLTSLNLVRLIGVLTPLNNFLSHKKSENRRRGEGTSPIFLIIFAIFSIWIFTLVGMTVIEEGMSFSRFIENGFSGRFLMNNLIYFNIIVLTTIVFYQNWEMQNSTARKLTERGDVLTIILENISEGVLVLDDQWNLVYANRAAIKLGNYSESDIGENIQNVVQLYTTEGELMDHKDIIQNLTTGDNLSCLLKTTIGNYKRVQIQISLLPRSRYGFKYLSLIRDITEEYEQEQRNIHTQKQEAIGRLVGGVAHDFNNRLAGIMGFAQLMEEEEDLTKLKEYATHIVNSSQAAADLTSQLLALSRKRPMVQIPLELSDLLDKLMPILHKTLDKGIELILNKSNTPLTTKGDPSLLENSLINLSLNASHAMNRKGIITFSTGTMIVDDIYSLKSQATLVPGRYAYLKVQDNGTGINPDVRDKIFDPFFTTKQEGEGTGLGLSTVREIVEKHGGEITVESQLGEGTCFIIILPLIEEQPQRL
jgi:PAS domain S-box-containing protein